MADGYSAADIAKLEAAYEVTVESRHADRGAFEKARDKLVAARQAFRLAEEEAGRRRGVTVEED
jgi:hypothetical protein